MKVRKLGASAVGRGFALFGGRMLRSAAFVDTLYASVAPHASVLIKVFAMKVERLEEKLAVVQQCIADRQERVSKIAELIGGLKSAKSLAPNVVEEAETHIGVLKELRKREKELTRDLEKVFLKFGSEKEEKSKKENKKAKAKKVKSKKAKTKKAEKKTDGEDS